MQCHNPCCKGFQAGRLLDLNRLLKRLALLLLPGLGLGTHDTSTPVAAVLFMLLLVAFLNGLDELG
jgi:hypothetical protein